LIAGDTKFADFGAVKVDVEVGAKHTRGIAEVAIRWDKVCKITLSPPAVLFDVGDDKSVTLEFDPSIVAAMLKAVQEQQP
jgi:hypothetical protein